MSDSTNETNKDLCNRMECYGRILNRLFAYFIWEIEFGKRVDGVSEWNMQTIRYACRDTTLLALRGLDDFFKQQNPGGPKGQNDDIRANCFGYTEIVRVLEDSDRAQINKLIAHTTKQGTDVAKYKWEILELARRAIAISDHFLEWVQTEFEFSEVALSEMARQIREGSGAMMATVVKIAEGCEANGSEGPN